jgi:hypothetical protein
MFGNIFNSAKDHSNQKIKNTIYKNPYFKANRFSLLERLFIYLAGNLGCFFVLLFALIVILICLVYFFYSVYIYDTVQNVCLVFQNRLCVIAFSESKYSILNFLGYGCEYCAKYVLPDIKKWQSDIFSINFSVLTFLLPLVITFISRLLQGKSSDEAIQNMYDELSGWRLILYSVPLQTIFHVLTPFYPQEFQKILPLIIIIWFSVNILLSFWFLRQTVRFLSLKKQMHNINRYIINYLPKYIKAILLRKNCKSQNNSSSNKKLKDNSEYSVPNIDQIIIMLFHQLEDALKANNASSFKNAIDKFINYYKQIEFSMSFINDNKKADNWLLFSKTFYSKSILDIFRGQFRNISQQTIDKIASNFNFFREWCFFYRKLFNIHSENKSQLNPQIVEYYVNDHYYIWHSLMLSIAGYNLSDKIIDSSIKYFIGSWESWKNYIKESKAEILCNHLENTSYMVISALKNNNQEATKWAIDSLVYWHKSFFIEYQHENHNRKNEVITPELFFDSEKLKEIYSRNADNIKQNIKQLKEIITNIEDKKDITFFNYWIDVRLLTAAYIMSCSDIKASKDYIDRLLNNDRLEANATEISVGKISNVDALLNARLRQKNFWIQEYDSSNIFAKHLRSLVGIEQPKWIIGRCYGSTGTVEDKYLTSFYQVIGIGLTTSEFDFHTWQQLLKNENVPDYYLDNIKNSLIKLTNDINDGIITKVCEYFEIDEEKAKTKAKIFKDSINKFFK